VSFRSFVIGTWVSRHLTLLCRSRSINVGSAAANDEPNELFVVLSNPWGYNLREDGSPGPGEVKVSLRAVGAVMIRVETTL
jgi:hypothetical protein